MTIQLHAFDTPNGRKVSVALEEMGLPYERARGRHPQAASSSTRVPEDQPEQQDPRHRRPEGPGGEPISVFESGAILIYLAEKTGRSGPRAAAHVATMEWLMFQMGGFGPMPGQVHHFIALDDEADRRYGWSAHGRDAAPVRRDERAPRRARVLRRQRLSIADFAIVGWAWRHPRHKVDLADYPHVQRWYQAMMARPGVARGFTVPLRRG